MYRTLLVINSLQPNLNEDLTVDSVSSKLYADYPGILMSDDKPVYEELFQKLENTPDPGDASKTVLERLREAFVASSIEGIAHAVAEQQQPFTALLEAFEKADVERKLDLAEEVGETWAELDLEKALVERNSKGALTWRLKYLNKSLGPLRKGDFGFIFARPETGKTTFLISEISNFLPQIDSKILWIANEEESTGIVARLYSSVLSIPISKILDNPSKYVDEFLEKGGNKIKLCNSASIRQKDINKFLEEEEYDLAIFDQLDKIHGFDAERYDLLMKAKYQWAREMAKKYCPVIGVCQAGGSGEGKQYLEMTDVDSSYTAKQGEADWILGIGKSDNEDLSSVRYLNILKNKLLGGGDSDPLLKHSKTHVKINLDIFRYEDIIYR